MLFLVGKLRLTVLAAYLHRIQRIQLAWNHKSLFSGKINKKKKISKCHLLKFLPSMLSARFVLWLCLLHLCILANYIWVGQDKLSIRKIIFVIFVKRYLVSTHWNHLTRAIPASTHKACFSVKITKVVTCYNIIWSYHICSYKHPGALHFLKVGHDSR